MKQEILKQANALNARIATLNAFKESIQYVLNNAKSLSEFNLDATFEITNGALHIWGEYTVPVLQHLSSLVEKDITMLQQEFDSL